MSYTPPSREEIAAMSPEQFQAELDRAGAEAERRAKEEWDALTPAEQEAAKADHRSRTRKRPWIPPTHEERMGR